MELKDADPTFTRLDCVYALPCGIQAMGASEETTRYGIAISDAARLAADITQSVLGDLIDEGRFRSAE